MGKKRLFTGLLLTAAIAFGCLATGCGAGKKSTGTKVEGMKYRGQDVSEPVELTMYLIGDKAIDFDKVYEQVNEILKKKVNATLHVKYRVLSESG